jgi:uncharacterized Zn finger protein
MSVTKLEISTTDRATLAELTDIAWIWQDWYDIGYENVGFTAQSKAGGPVITARTPRGLRQALRDDFAGGRGVGDR